MSPLEVIFWIGFAIVLLILVIVVLICFVELTHRNEGKWPAIWTIIGIAALILFALLYVWGSSQKGIGA